MMQLVEKVNVKYCNKAKSVSCATVASLKCHKLKTAMTCWTIHTAERRDCSWAFHSSGNKYKLWRTELMQVVLKLEFIVNLTWNLKYKCSLLWVIIHIFSDKKSQVLNRLNSNRRALPRTPGRPPSAHGNEFTCWALPLSSLQLGTAFQHDYQMCSFVRHLNFQRVSAALTTQVR